MSDVLRPEDTPDRGLVATGQMNRQGFLLRAAAGGVLIASSPQLDDRLGRGSATRGGVLKMARNEEAQSFDPIVPGDNGSIYTSLINQTDVAGTGWVPTVPGLFVPGGSCDGST